MRTNLWLGLAALATVNGMTGAALAQDFPTEPIRIVIGYAPGGGNDILARLIAPKMGEALGQQVIAENMPGAGGNIGAQATARAEADGHTLLMANNAFTINPFIFDEPGFDVAADFETISLVASAPMLIVVNPAIKASTLGELIDHAQANPGALNYGTPGSGTPQHLATELFKSAAGVDLTHIPFGGTGPSVVGLLQGEVQMMFATPASVEQYIAAGQLTPLAVTSSTRMDAFPEIETVREAGLEEYEMEIWWGLVGPAGMPEDVRALLNETVVNAVNDPEVQRIMAAQGMNPRPGSAEEFASLIGTDLEQWGRIVAQIDLTEQ